MITLPLLRYRIGDLVEQHVQPYGNHFTVHGRVRDALMARDGRRVTTWQVDQCFAGMDGIAHYELRQSENGDCVLRFVPEGTGPTKEELRGAAARLENRLQLSAEIKPRRCRFCCRRLQENSGLLPRRRALNPRVFDDLTWQTDFVRAHTACLARSLKKWTGRDLLPAFSIQLNLPRKFLKRRLSSFRMARRRIRF